MIDVIEVDQRLTLDDYSSYLHLRSAVDALRGAAQAPVQALQDRTVWMVNSTAQGGGVAEMLPKVVTLLRELGVPTQWAVIRCEEPRFFELTKHLHNLLHGSGEPTLERDDRALYERVSRDLADAFRPYLGPRDVIVIHDPQPLGMGALLSEEEGVPAIWRCHIGLDEDTPQTRAAWSFMRPWAEAYQKTIFTLDDYVPSFLADRSTVIHPAIDPLSSKNRELPTHTFTGILSNAALVDETQPTLTPSFEYPARRVQLDGSLAPANQPDDMGLLFRPVVTQISRWDRLKGFAPLLEGFARLKQGRHERTDLTDRHRRRLDLVRLVLAGPDPASIQDDPEGVRIFEAMRSRWMELDPALQKDVALLALPMVSRKHNALMVNVLQRCSTIVVQNSLREGFGLTASEAMWKERPVLGTRAAGLQAQIETGVHGRLVDDPEDPEALAAALDDMLENAEARATWGRNARRQVADRFLVFTQVRRWLEELAALARRGQQ